MTGNDYLAWQDWVIAQRRRRKRRTLRRFMAVILLAVLVLSLWLAPSLQAYANSGGGESGKISDVEVDTVEQRRSAERRHDANWAREFADSWDELDHGYCSVKVLNMEPDPHRRNLAYIRCMIHAGNAKILYLMKRGCTGIFMTDCMLLEDDQP